MGEKGSTTGHERNEVHCRLHLYKNPFNIIFFFLPENPIETKGFMCSLWFRSAYLLYHSFARSHSFTTKWKCDRDLVSHCTIWWVKLTRSIKQQDTSKEKKQEHEKSRIHQGGIIFSISFKYNSLYS